VELRLRLMLEALQAGDKWLAEAYLLAKTFPH